MLNCFRGGGGVTTAFLLGAQQAVSMHMSDAALGILTHFAAAGGLLAATSQ